MAVYLDAGPAEVAVASSTVDLSGAVSLPKRAGGISAERQRKIVPAGRT
ncbi:hypothetical protein AB0M39_11725 [Streptomyces sp. NPDC051907]